jgi:hypothetical protein
VLTANLGERGVTTELIMSSIARVGLSHDINEKWSAQATGGGGFPV